MLYNSGQEVKIELRKYLSDKITNFNLLRQMLVTLDKMPFENKKKLIKTLKECDYNEYAYKVAVNFKVLEKRTIEDQIKLIKALKECDYNEYVYKVAVNFDVLKNITIEGQIKLMKEIKICHGENIGKIANLAEFKMYLEKLKKELGRDADVNNYTKVLRFKSETKEEK